MVRLRHRNRQRKRIRQRQRQGQQQRRRQTQRQRLRTRRGTIAIVTLTLTLTIMPYTVEVHAFIMAGLRDVMANAVSARIQAASVRPNIDEWASSNLALNTRPRVKRGGGL